MGNEYGRLERRIADLLTNFPEMKNKVKKGYQRINSLLHRKPYVFQSDYHLHVLPVEAETFFGYYDKSPLSQDGCYILFNETSSLTNAAPLAGREITVGVYDLHKHNILCKYPTFSYNWQQGAKAQWLNEKEFIFNTYNVESHQYQAVIINVNNGQRSLVCRPVYDCFKDQYALTLNFGRLMALRPDYGYRNEVPLTEDALRYTDEDGVFYVDLISNTSRLLISLSDLKKINPLTDMDNALHKVNHIMISPDGRHFIFLHRYFINGRKFDRLFVADPVGADLKLLADDGMVSHCCWLDNDQIVGYLRDKTEGDRYYKINILTGERSIVGKNKIDKYGDGHPGISGHKMIFDTYPDKARMKHLLLFDLETGELKQLGEFYEGLNFYGETRCDLHPRFSPNGKQVFFDSVHEGKRKLYWINL